MRHVIFPFVLHLGPRIHLVFSTKVQVGRLIFFILNILMRDSNSHFYKWHLGQNYLLEEGTDLTNSG